MIRTENKTPQPHHHALAEVDTRHWGDVETIFREIEENIQHRSVHHLAERMFHALAAARTYQSSRVIKSTETHLIGNKIRPVEVYKYQPKAEGGKVVIRQLPLGPPQSDSISYRYMITVGAARDLPKPTVQTTFCIDPEELSVRDDIAGQDLEVSSAQTFQDELIEALAHTWFKYICLFVEHETEISPTPQSTI